jgi:hypothetical protein
VAISGPEKISRGDHDAICLASVARHPSAIALKISETLATSYRTITYRTPRLSHEVKIGQLLDRWFQITEGFSSSCFC